MKMMLCNVGNFDFLCDVDFNFMKIVVIGMVNFYGIFIWKDYIVKVIVVD